MKLLFAPYSVPSKPKIKKMPGCEEAISRLKKAAKERERISRKIELRSNKASKILKLSSTPCIFIDINLGKKEDERIIIFEKDNPSIIAKDFAKKHRIYLTKISTLMRYTD